MELSQLRLGTDYKVLTCNASYVGFFLIRDGVLDEPVIINHKPTPIFPYR